MEFSELDLHPGDRIALRVTPGARQARIALVAGADGGVMVRVWVTVAPEGGKANAAVLKALAKALGLPKSRLCLERGASGRDKLVRVLG